MTPSRNPSVRRPEAIRNLLASLTLALAACGGDSEQANSAPPPPPPPAQEVAVESVEDVMKRLGIDRRVKMDESERPSLGDPADMQRLETVLRFFDAMVKGDADRLRPMLSKPDQATLELMTKDGQWAAATSGIDRVTVGCCAGPEPETCAVLAIFATGDRFDPQLWTLSGTDSLSLAAVPQPRGIMEQLKGNKAEPRVQQWTRILKDQADRAKQPDEKVEITQQDRSVNGEDSGSEDGSSPGQPSAPEAPKGPGKRKPGGTPVPGPKGPGGPSPGAPGGPSSPE
jgi:hypothetical protein